VPDWAGPTLDSVSVVEVADVVVEQSASQDNGVSSFSLEVTEEVKLANWRDLKAESFMRLRLRLVRSISKSNSIHVRIAHYFYSISLRSE